MANGLFHNLQVSASALTAERVRLDVIANNLANLHTTRTAEGGAYKRHMVVFAAKGVDAQGPSQIGQGVQVDRIVMDQTPGRRIHQPGHPDADANGYVLMPNVEPIMEMTDLVAATRAYEANIAAINTTKNMFSKALELGRA